MDPKLLVTIILYGPLIGAVVAGLLGRRIGDVASMSITTGFLFLSAILSWVVFHKEYLDDYKPPYNVVAVQLEEGPITISNLSGPEPSGTWIGKAVEIIYESGADGETLPRVRLIKE